MIFPRLSSEVPAIVLDLRGRLSSLSTHEEADLASRVLRERATLATEEWEGRYIERQEETYREWQERREREVQRQFEMYQR